MFAFSFSFTIFIILRIIILKNRICDAMKNSRVRNSIRNSTVSIITQILTVLINFIVKTVFIHTLGSEYLGVNGLFSNIITMLSLADLGIGVAIPYSLYKPLADKDSRKINILMKFYAKVYNVIGIIVLLIGLSLTPFLGAMIKDMPDISNLKFIYALFVIHSASSYFFVYKRFLIESDQKGYITSMIVFVFSTVLSVIQIILLIFTKNYILFLLSSILIVIIQNIYISKKAMQLYPFLKQKKVGKMAKEDIQEIKQNVSALLIYRIGNVITSGTDNIIISKYIGLVMVGVYSNYLLIINSLNMILNQVFNAITSSIGNLVVTTSTRRSANIYEKLNLFNFWLYSFCGICLLVLINPFIEIWIGKKYLLSFPVVFLLSLNFYITGMQSVTTSFRNAYGLFWKAKYCPLIMIIINMVVSIILVQFLGITGVILGTIISRVLTVAWLDPCIIYKHGFHRRPSRYFVKYALFFVLFLGTAFFINWIVSFIPNGNILWLFLKIMICCILINGIFYFIFKDTDDFGYFYEKLKIFLVSKVDRFRHS